MKEHEEHDGGDEKNKKKGSLLGRALFFRVWPGKEENPCHRPRPGLVGIWGDWQLLSLLFDRDRPAENLTGVQGVFSFISYLFLLPHTHIHPALILRFAVVPLASIEPFQYMTTHTRNIRVTNLFCLGRIRPPE